MPERAEVFLMTREFKSKFPPGSQIQKIKILNRDSKFTLTLSETDFPLPIISWFQREDLHLSY